MDGNEPRPPQGGLPWGFIGFSTGAAIMGGGTWALAAAALCTPVVALAALSLACFVVGRIMAESGPPVRRVDMDDPAFQVKFSAERFGTGLTAAGTIGLIGAGGWGIKIGAVNAYHYATNHL